MTSISFTANHIKDLQVFRAYEKGAVPQKVSFVEFFPTNIEAVNEFKSTNFATLNYYFVK